jgi:hypothetical protein
MTDRAFRKPNNPRRPSGGDCWDALCILRAATLQGIQAQLIAQGFAGATGPEVGQALRAFVLAGSAVCTEEGWYACAKTKVSGGMSCPITSATCFAISWATILSLPGWRR